MTRGDFSSGVGRTLTRALVAAFGRPGRTLRLIVLVQLPLLAVGIPFLAWLYPALLGVLGARSILAVSIADVFRQPAAAAVTLLLAAITAALFLTELLAFLVGTALVDDTGELRARPFVRRLRDLAGRLAHPSTLLLLPYTATLLPFTGFAFGGLFTGGVRVPFPLTDQLLASLPGSLVYLALAAAIAVLHARLALTLPLLAAGEQHVGTAFRTSWRLTRGRTLRILAVAGVVVGAAAVVAAGISTLGLEPTRYADNAVPDAALGVAAVSLTVIEITIFVLVGFTVALLAHAAMAAARRTAAPTPDGDGRPARSPRDRRRRALLGIAGAVVVLAVATLSNVGVLSSLSDGRSTAIVAHRGEFTSAVENTVAAVRAASAAQPDFVEIDVQETRDRELVVFHDLTLRRLADDPRRISDLTMRELRDITLRQGDREDRIPTLDEVIEVAVELEQPLVLELKPHGGESDDFVDNVVETLREHDVLEEYRVASFDRTIVAGLHELAPELRLGVIVRYNLGRVPDTPADFIVVNVDSYSPALRDDAWSQGLELYVWTVDDTRAMRILIRDSADGVITDRVYAARAVQQDIVYETGVASRLEDALGRLFGW